MKLRKLLDDIKISPNLYLGQPSITRLSAFIDGYVLGSSCQSFLGEFQEWIAEKYGIKSTHKWSDIILFFEQDENSAFQRFFELIEEFFLDQEK